mmetsp:Transcript_14141/g.34375  ORF Transcript_14141/g.34375 Transcript_14141/m.34375 type:complete len:95 (+) Transcript_14141:353-637(+)
MFPSRSNGDPNAAHTESTLNSDRSVAASTDGTHGTISAAIPFRLARCASASDFHLNLDQQERDHQDSARESRGPRSGSRSNTQTRMLRKPSSPP